MDRATAQRLNSELNVHLTALQELSKKLAQLIPKRSTLMSQQNENEMVKKEFDLLSDDSRVFKLNGPVLVKQDVSEAKVTVMNRIKFFTAEMSVNSMGGRGRERELGRGERRLEGKKTESRFPFFWFRKLEFEREGREAAEKEGCMAHSSILLHRASFDFLNFCLASFPFFPPPSSSPRR